MMTLLLVHALATVLMFGVILTVQLVHYPLFAVVGDLRFVAYHREHMRLIRYVVTVPMVVELATAVALTLRPPPGVPTWLVWIGLALVILIWVSTWLVQVPRHADLTKGFDSVAHERLVRSNWIRTAAWGVRSGVALIMIYHFIC
ncbi:MAG TPA: hypothetical protein VMO47_15050 [Rhodothermales bacterium]|nr:hypothetical protein [Rhodothermales bacterium]